MFDEDGDQYQLLTCKNEEADEHDTGPSTAAANLPNYLSDDFVARLFGFLSTNDDANVDDDAVDGNIKESNDDDS